RGVLFRPVAASAGDATFQGGLITVKTAPTKAGAHTSAAQHAETWIPAFAGMGFTASVSSDPFSAPLAGAELGAVDDAAVLVASGAEHHRAGHRTVLEAALEMVGQVACLVALLEPELHHVRIERAGDRPVELRRFLVAAQRRAVLVENQPMGARALQEIDLQL